MTQVRLNQLIFAAMVLIIGFFLLKLVKLLAIIIIAVAAVVIVYELWQMLQQPRR